MIGVDTNVVIRMVTNDDPRQVGIVREFLVARSSSDPAFVSSLVLAESIWVLQTRLHYPLDRIVKALATLLESQELRFQYADRLRTLLDAPSSLKADLSDYLIAWSAESAGCSHTVTFDRRAARAIGSMSLLA